MSDRPGLVIVIDGPAGAGKSTVAKRVAKHFSLPYLDTGAIYRTLALAAERRGVSWDDGTALADIARALPIRFEGDPQRVFLEREDVSAAIRTPSISQGASRVSAHAPVRDALLELQRALGARGCTAEGRDMGTVVFPGASHKFFLTADLEVRAARRHRDLGTGGNASAPTLVDVARDMAQRDTRDSNRAAAPLQQAQDAVLIDSTHLDADGVVAKIVAVVENAGG